MTKKKEHRIDFGRLNSWTVTLHRNSHGAYMVARHTPTTAYKQAHYTDTYTDAMRAACALARLCLYQMTPL